MKNLKCQSLNLLSAVFFFFILTFNIHNLRAQETVASKEDSQFRAVIQYISGQASVKYEEHQMPLEFKSILFDHGKIETTNEGYIKWITENRCVAVLYGGQLNIDSSKKAQNIKWELISGSLRWVCPESAKGTDYIQLNGESIKIKPGGELFYHQNTLAVLKKGVSPRHSSQGIDEFLPLKAYHWESPAWVISKKLFNVDELTKFVHLLPQPKEALNLAQKEKPFHLSSRWVIGPVFGGLQMNHALDSMSKDLDMNEGFRAQTNFMWGKYSIIASINSWVSHEGEPWYDGPPPEDFSNMSLEAEWIDIGTRFGPLEKSWSFFWKIGIGNIFHDVHPPYLGNISYFNLNVDYFSLFLTIGIDKEFVIESYKNFGFYISAQLNWIKTLSTNSPKDIKNSPDFPPEIYDYDKGLSLMGLGLYFGPMLRF